MRKIAIVSVAILAGVVSTPSFAAVNLVVGLFSPTFQTTADTVQFTATNASISTPITANVTINQSSQKGSTTYPLYYGTYDPHAGGIHLDLNGTASQLTDMTVTIGGHSIALDDITLPVVTGSTTIEVDVFYSPYPHPAQAAEFCASQVTGWTCKQIDDHTYYAVGSYGN